VFGALLFAQAKQVFTSAKVAELRDSLGTSGGKPGPRAFVNLSPKGSLAHQLVHELSDFLKIPVVRIDGHCLNVYFLIHAYTSYVLAMSERFTIKVCKELHTKGRGHPYRMSLVSLLY
jgi:hypothetical protein